MRIDDTTFELIIIGRVQGVGYRAWAKKNAKNFFSEKMNSLNLFKPTQITSSRSVLNMKVKLIKIELHKIVLLPRSHHLQNKQKYWISFVVLCIFIQCQLKPWFEHDLKEHSLHLKGVKLLFIV